MASSWTAEQYSYLIGVTSSEASKLKEKLTIGLKSKSGLGWNKAYAVFWIVPAVIALCFRIIAIDRENPAPIGVWAGAILFASGVIGIAFALNQKNRKYLKAVREQNTGREFVFTEDSILVSTGEMARGEANAVRFDNNGLMTWAREQEFVFLRVPFAMCSHFSLEGRTLFLVPADGVKNTFEIVIGTSRDDEDTAGAIGAQLSKHLKREKRNVLLEV